MSLTVRTPSDTNPGSTFVSLTKLRNSSPAPINNTNEGAISGTTMKLRRLRLDPLPIRLRLPSLTARVRLTCDARKAGKRPKSIPVSIVTAQVNMRT